jgi:hypothetical protein
MRGRPRRRCPFHALLHQLTSDAILADSERFSNAQRLLVTVCIYRRRLLSVARGHVSRAAGQGFQNTLTTNPSRAAFAGCANPST